MKRLYIILFILLSAAILAYSQTKLGGKAKIGGKANVATASGGGGGGPSGNPLIISFTVGTLRNDSNIFVGGHFRTEVGFVRTPAYLCRRHIASQTQTHNLYLYEDGAPDVQLATVSIDASSAANYTDANSVPWNCGAISASAIGNASTTKHYYLFSQEFSGGDTWLENDSTVTSTIANTTWQASTFTSSLGSHTDTGSGVYVPVNVLFAP